MGLRPMDMVHHMFWSTAKEDPLNLPDVTRILFPSCSEILWVITCRFYYFWFKKLLRQETPSLPVKNKITKHWPFTFLLLCIFSKASFLLWLLHSSVHSPLGFWIDVATAINSSFTLNFPTSYSHPSYLQRKFKRLANPPCRVLAQFNREEVQCTWAL